MAWQPYDPNYNNRITEELNSAYNHNMDYIFLYLDYMFSVVCGMNDFDREFGASSGSSGASTATVSKATNGSFDAMGNYNSTLIITYNDGKVINIPVKITAKAIVDDPEIMMNQLVSETQLILDTDISYFDDLIDGDYDILIETGSDIADGYYARNPAQAKGNRAEVLSGLHTPNGKKSATFRIASELFKVGGDPRHIYPIEGKSSFLGLFESYRYTLRTTIWEAFAHEVGHELDLLSNPSGFKFLTLDQREISTINRVNNLRIIRKSPIQFYP